MRTLILASLAISLSATPALAGPKSEQASNGRTCSSAGATAENPGQWLKALRDHPALLDLSPNEIAELENSTVGWAGYGETPNVGALIEFFCEGGRDD